MTGRRRCSIFWALASRAQVTQERPGSSRVSLEHVNVDGKRIAVKVFLQRGVAWMGAGPHNSIRTSMRRLIVSSMHRAFPWCFCLSSSRGFISGFYSHSGESVGLGACWCPIVMKRCCNLTYGLVFRALGVLGQHRGEHAWDNFSDSLGFLPIQKDAKNRPRRFSVAVSRNALGPDADNPRQQRGLARSTSSSNESTLAIG